MMASNIYEGRNKLYIYHYQVITSFLFILFILIKNLGQIVYIAYQYNIPIVVYIERLVLFFKCNSASTF